MTAIEALITYNFIRQTEERIAEGEYIENLDLDAMEKAKKAAKEFLENTLNIQMN